MKASFYRTKADYIANNYQINLVGHSMGGLVSRYYIENLGYDDHVEKLITIDTPHWGSGYANASVIPGLHKLCDHDLALTSEMNNPNSTSASPTLGICLYCPDNYLITPKLLNPSNRKTDYYAIAGVDFFSEENARNDYCFEMPTNYTTYKQVSDFIKTKNIYHYENGKRIEIDIHNNGDNMVGFLSQIGWKNKLLGEIEDNERIRMKKIFIDVDTNKGNGGDVPIIEALFMLHGKIHHRTAVMDQVYKYLKE